MFKNKAQFAITDLLEATKEDVKDSISMEMLITLFEHHNIIAPLPITRDRKDLTYFMPSILRSATKDELQNGSYFCRCGSSRVSIQVWLLTIRSLLFTYYRPGLKHKTKLDFQERQSLSQQD